MGYSRLGADLGAEVAPAGPAWAEALRRDPSLELWADDGKHPSLLGSYLAACVFYGELSGRTPGRTRSRQASPSVSCLLLMAAEIVAGTIGHSLALLADAGHLLTDAAALGFALVAAAMAARPAAGRWTVGYSRLEILSAQANGITLGLIALWVVWSAVHRLVDPREVRGGLVLTVALGGVLVSLRGAFLQPRSRSSTPSPRPRRSRRADAIARRAPLGR